VKATVSETVRRSLTIDAESRLLACRIVSGIRPFQFTILPAENGYRLRVNHGAAEYLWPSTYPTLEKAGEQILKALTTASECRGESQPPQRAPSQTKTTAGF
jgi:hypothetical protein